MDRSAKIGAAILGSLAAIVWGAVLLVPAATPPSSAPGTHASAPPEFTPSETPTVSSDTSVVLFIGDSYTAGMGSSSSSKRWTTIVSRRMGWEETNLGLGGTGYKSTAGSKRCGLDFCPNYQAVAMKVTKDDPDTIIVAGGQNDFNDWIVTQVTVTKAVRATYRRLRDDHPDATIVAVGPSDVNRIGQSAQGVDAVVQAAAKEVDAQYVSLLKPRVITKEMVLPDGRHVNDAGHAAIAKRVLLNVQK